MQKALIIGLQNYPQAPLLGCVMDAKEVYQLLKTHEDQSTNFGCKLLTDEEEIVNP